jgi:deoxycytidylate deaminase
MSSLNKNDSELVIGIIKTAGTDISHVIQNIEDRLKCFEYKVKKIKVSSEILYEFSDSNDICAKNEHDRISHYMDLGNKIRSTTGDYSVLMKGVVSKILLDRENIKSPSPRKRIAYIVDSIKHPDEVSFMRKTYGVGFHLIGVTSIRKRRIEYLTKEKGVSLEQAEAILERDSAEDLEYGQHTRDAFQNSDYFINVSNNTDEIRNNTYRLIDLLFGDPFNTPTFSEYAMFMAYASSLRSADLSRQIGSVIAKNGEIIASGVNDCPKFGGGLYWLEYSDSGYKDVIDGRDYMLGHDSNKAEQKKIISRILASLNIKETEEKVKLIKNAGIGDLTEYGRVVHSEMEALLMCSRNNISCRDAEMYVTTFPCHNCAKHIITAGIKKVIYIEPYPKSKAFEFYKEEISEDLNDNDKVFFIPFTGVGPQRFIDLFSTSSIYWYKRIRKNKDGIKIPWDKSNASLRNPMNVLNYLDSEVAAFNAYTELVKKYKFNSNS